MRLLPFILLAAAIGHSHAEKLAEESQTTRKKKEQKKREQKSVEEGIRLSHLFELVFACVPISFSFSLRSTDSIDHS